MQLESPLLPILCLLASSLATAFNTALHKFGKLHAKKAFTRSPNLFFFQRFLHFLFPKREWEGLIYSLVTCKQILQITYATTGFLFLLDSPLFSQTLTGALFIFIVLLLFFSLALDFLMNLIASRQSLFFLKATSPLISPLLLITAPITLLIQKGVQKNHDLEGSKHSSSRIRDRIIEILDEVELSTQLDSNDQKLILSVATFKEKMVREIMVPRVDVFSLPVETTIQDAATRFLSERYSRIPVYKETVDHITGVLLYKDLLNSYIEALNKKDPEQALSCSLEGLLKPVLYTPETKKISQLLQEFRNKQLHLAIVVDEYGGTEGIITIEDILEELVGEIADEHDQNEELLFTSLPTGGWIVDAKMGIIDIEEELGIKIPPSPEYDTIGGFVFHRAGSIPSKGWRMHYATFDLEVLSSDERSIEKILIKPRSSD